MLAYTYYNALETPTITEKLSSIKDQGRIIHEAGEAEALEPWPYRGRYNARQVQRYRKLQIKFTK